ncbi:MAG: hypothetical protein KGJ89_00565 [Patescibacteria group bacterium]|nr:hypothetical protein [Patescibacteria group bacterium]MDE2015007.1 hypothetical protein [Patescibacteria group bacterium]MDE2226435.1 hypothetical protein [Patescibacteria group bacterium]
MDDISIIAGPFTDDILNVFFRTFGFWNRPVVNEKTVTTKKQLRVRDKFLIRNNEQIVTALENRRLGNLLQKLRWANPPSICLAQLETYPKRIRLVTYVTKFSVFPKRILSFCKKSAFLIAGEHVMESNAITICPENLWRASNKNPRDDDVFRYKRALTWTLAHELGHSWLHKQKHWTHVPPWFIRVILAVPRLFQQVILAHKEGRLAIAAGLLFYIFLLPQQLLTAVEYTICSLLVTIALLWLDKIILPIMIEMKADEFAEKFMLKNGEELSRCISARKESPYSDIGYKTPTPLFK